MLDSINYKFAVPTPPKYSKGHEVGSEDVDTHPQNSLSLQEDVVGTLDDRKVIIFKKQGDKSLQQIVSDDDDDIFFDCKEEEDNCTENDNELTRADFVEQRPNSSQGTEDEHEGSPSKWTQWAGKVSAFSQSVVGSKLIQTGKTVVGQSGGAFIASKFPEASIAYAAGKAIANKIVDESKNKSTIVQGAGIAAALSVTALTTGISYLTGTPMEYGQALGYLVQTSGTIAGSMSGLEAAGQTVPDGYIPRAAISLAATDAVDKAASAAASLPLPASVSTTIAVAGMALKTISGMAAYYTPETITLANKLADLKLQSKLQSRNLYDPGEFIQNVAEHARLDLSAVAESQAKQFIESPLVSSFISNIMQFLLKHSIDKKLGTNVFIRAVNDFAKIIQDEGIQQKIKELKAAPDETKKDLLKKEIAYLVEQKYGFIEKGIASIMQSQSDPLIPALVTQIVETISKKEIEYFSFELSNAAQTKDLLEVLLPSLIPLIGVYAKREVLETKDLRPEEIEAFYQNFNEVIFAPYSDYWLARGVQGLVSVVVPVMQHAQFIPAILSEKIGLSLAGPTNDTEIDNTESEEQEPRLKPEAETRSEQTVLQSIQTKIDPITRAGKYIDTSQIVQKIPSTTMTGQNLEKIFAEDFKAPNFVTPSSWVDEFVNTKRSLNMKDFREFQKQVSSSAAQVLHPQKVGEEWATEFLTQQATTSKMKLTKYAATTFAVGLGAFTAYKIYQTLKDQNKIEEEDTSVIHDSVNDEDFDEINDGDKSTSSDLEYTLFSN